MTEKRLRIAFMILLWAVGLLNLSVFVDHFAIHHHWDGLLNLLAALFCIVPAILGRNLDTRFGSVRECPTCGQKDYVHPGTDTCTGCIVRSSVMTESKAYETGYRYGSTGTTDPIPLSCNTKELMAIFKMGLEDGRADHPSMIYL